MTRFFVPITLALAVSGLAFTLIAVVVARSPYVHANLEPAGYTRTEIIYVGPDEPFDGLGLADPRLARTGDPVRDGRALFFQHGCLTCHGLEAQGGVIGPDLRGTIAPVVRAVVRVGPRGMPTYAPSLLPDEDLEKIIAFLEAQQARRVVP